MKYREGDNQMLI